ncbi:hypothetical protein PHYBOEH_005713 [Phytophthora boehmeriae]|uniref:Uncharacterized protein n=1 Tax=Phytophthora boehmeriae TaxID=109152 RepID=A0A8T1XFR4_9STRA|nr:hypothetical protein PHYBOEH_005713 [Phytophthora boehmeriae]
MMAANPTRKLAAQCTAEQSERLPQLVCVAVVCRQFPSVAVKTTIVRRIEAFVDVAAGCSLQDACAKSLWLAKRVVALNEWTSGHDDEWRRESAIEALGAAAGCGKLKLVQWLCAEAETIAGVDAVVVVRGKYADRRWTAMHGAAMHGHLDVVKWLVAQGARVDEKDDGNMTPLRFACCWGHLSVAQWLFDKGARLDTLHGAARTGCLPVAQWLLDNGASVNEKDRSAGTPLHSAVYSISGTQSERFAIVEWLVNQGARVNAKDDFGCTVLHNVHEGDSVVEFLIDHGAAVNEKCESGETALHGAALRGYFSIVRLLVSKGARVDEKDNAGRTALHNAAYGGHLNLVQWLVDQGAHVDEQDTNGSTALHGAARLQDPHFTWTTPKYLVAA